MEEKNYAEFVLDFIKKKAKKKGMAPSAFAKKKGVAANTLCNLKKTNRKDVMLSTAIKVGAARLNNE